MQAIFAVNDPARPLSFYERAFGSVARPVAQAAQGASLSQTE
jgi:hypothetical protein